MKIAILGSGAVGGYFGARLANAGHDVTFIARGAHLAAIRAHGLEVKSPLGDFTARGPAEDDPARVGVVECVIVAVKNYDNATALPLLRPMVGAHTAVLTIQNGVDGVEECARVVGAERVLGGVTYVFSALDAPGRIVQTGTTGRIVFGEVFDPPATRSPRVEAIADVLASAAIDVQAVADARPSLWEKLAYLANFAGLTAGARRPIGELWSLPGVRETFVEGFGEVERVARAEGVPLPPGLIGKYVAFVGGLPPSSKSSLLMDLEKRRRIEVEALLGSVVRRGTRGGVPTPVLTTLYAVLKPHEHGDRQS